MGYVIEGLIVAVVFGVGGFIAGLLVYRKNAKKFSDLEAAAKAKGKSVEDIVKAAGI